LPKWQVLGEQAVSAAATTEDQIIIQHTEAWFKKTGWNENQFAEQRIIPALEQEKPEPERFDEKTASVPEYKKWITSRKQKVARALNGSTTFPLHWKWIWLSCMDEPYRSACKADLLALSGAMDIPIPVYAPKASGGPVRANIADFMRETADVLEAASPAHDGVYCRNDDIQAANNLCDQLLDVMNVCSRELAAIESGTGCRGRRSQLGSEVALMAERISKAVNKH